MTTQQLEQNLLDFIGGYNRRNPENLALLREYPDWQRMAKLELDRRTSQFLDGLPIEELRAIASGAIDLGALAAKAA